MKSHLLTLTAAALLLQVAAYSQVLSIEWHAPNPMYAGAQSTAIIDGDLVNHTGAAMNILFSCDVSQMHSGHSGSFCFGEQCFPLFDCTDDPTVRADQYLPANGRIDVHAWCNPNNVNGVTSISYNMFDKDDQEKAVAFTVTYVLGPSSVADATEFGISVGPNPIKDVATITGAKSVVGINLYSYEGALLRTYGFVQSDAIQLNMSDVASGPTHLIFTMLDGKVLRTPISVIR